MESIIIVQYLGSVFAISDANATDAFIDALEGYFSKHRAPSGFYLYDIKSDGIMYTGETLPKHMQSIPLYRVSLV